MDIFSCIVKLRSGAESGIFTGEVPKTDVSAAEILLLKSLHQDDAVTNIVKTGNDKSRKNAVERERLNAIYGPLAVTRVFGKEAWRELPRKLPAAAEPAAEDMAA